MDKTTTIRRDDTRYPFNVEWTLQGSAPESITARGNLSILDGHKVALFCSQSCPGDLATQAYDVAQHLRDAGVTVAGGFHSPMEKECLKIFLSSPYPVVVGLGRHLNGSRRLPGEFERPLQEERLLVLSCFGKGINRVTIDTAHTRNLFIAALADKVFVAHAQPGGHTESFCRKVLSWGKPLYTLESERNTELIAGGAVAMAPDQTRDQLAG